jgi:phage baseplate assembly protein gpV
MDRFLNALKGQAGALDQGQAQPRFGTVTSVNPDTATARVLLQPEAVLTGWLPFLSPWIGDGWGMSCPPSPGDQVLVVAQEGDAEHGVIVGRSFSADAVTPTAASGEFWLVHSSGSHFKLLNDGTVRIGGNVTVTGDLVVSGDVSDGHGKLAGLRSHYNGHHHTDSRGGQTSTSDKQD